jgi:hypothetical protein
MEKVLEKTGTLSSKDKGTYHVHDRIKCYHPFSLGWFHQSCYEIYSMTSKIISLTKMYYVVVLLHFFLQMYKTIKLWNKVENGTLQNILSSWSGNFGSVQKKVLLLSKSNLYISNFLQGKCSRYILGRNGELKSFNLQYNTLRCWVDGPNDSSTKRLMFQVLFFLFLISYRLRALKALYFYFCKVVKKIKKKLKGILKNNAWNIRRLVDKLFGPSTQQCSVLYWRLTSFYSSPIAPLSWSKLYNQVPSLSLSRWRTLTLLKI